MEEHGRRNVGLGGSGRFGWLCSPGLGGFGGHGGCGCQDGCDSRRRRRPGSPGGRRTGVHGCCAEAERVEVEGGFPGLSGFGRLGPGRLGRGSNPGAVVADDFAARGRAAALGPSAHRGLGLVGREVERRLGVLFGLARRRRAPHHHPREADRDGQLGAQRSNHRHGTRLFPVRHPIRNPGQRRRRRTRPCSVSRHGPRRTEGRLSGLSRLDRLSSLSWLPGLACLPRLSRLSWLSWLSWLGRRRRGV